MDLCFNPKVYKIFNIAGICKNESIQSFFRLYDINIKSGMSYLRGLCFSND